MRPRVVLDTNILISGLLFGGGPRRILEQALRGSVKMITSPILIAELEHVLHEKFPHAQMAIRDTLEALKELAFIVEPGIIISAIPEDPDDNRVLECAVSAKAPFIISGDHHLLALKKFRGIRILTPREFMDLQH